MGVDSNLAKSVCLPIQAGRGHNFAAALPITDDEAGQIICWRTVLRDQYIDLRLVLVWFELEQLQGFFCLYLEQGVNEGQVASGTLEENGRAGINTIINDVGAQFRVVNGQTQSNERTKQIGAGAGQANVPNRVGGLEGIRP